LKEEIEKQEELALKENLKQAEIKKKNALDKKKPFDLMTEKRPIEKENKKIENPVIGKVKVVLGPNRTPTITVYEGISPEIMAINFMKSHSIKKEHKPKIINHIQQVIDQKMLNCIKNSPLLPSENSHPNNQLSPHFKSYPTSPSFAPNHLPDDPSAMLKDTPTKAEESSDKRGLLYKVRIKLEEEGNLVVNVRQGDNLYTLANEVVKKHGLDMELVHQIRNLLARPSQFK
jgi:hypothetical protein